MSGVDPRAPRAAVRVVRTMSGVDPELVRAVREGTYSVDPRAVAEAMFRRHQASGLGAVLKALERDAATGGRPEEDSGPRADVA